MLHPLSDTTTDKSVFRRDALPSSSIEEASVLVPVFCSPLSSSEDSLDYIARVGPLNSGGPVIFCTGETSLRHVTALLV